MTIKEYNETIVKTSLTKEEILGLIQKAQDGDELAMNVLIETNTKLVYKITNDLLPANVTLAPQLEMEDLYQAGKIGLIEAIQHFDTNAGTTLTTYAYDKIAKCVREELKYKNSTIKVPSHVQRLYSFIQEVKETLKETNCEITIDTIFNYIDTHQGLIPETILKRYPSGIKKKHIKDALSVYGYNANVTSLNVEIEPENHSELLYTVEDKTAPSTEDSAIASVVFDTVIKKIHQVSQSDRDAEILMYRLGLMEEKPYTLQQIGDIFGLSKMRIQQICDNNLAKLKADKDLQALIVA